MDFRQNFDGMIWATFKPEEVDALARVVKIAEAGRIEAIAIAEKQKQEAEALPPTTPSSQE